MKQLFIYFPSLKSFSVLKVFRSIKLVFYFVLFTLTPCFFLNGLANASVNAGSMLQQEVVRGTVTEETGEPSWGYCK